MTDKSLKHRITSVGQTAPSSGDGQFAVIFDMDGVLVDSAPAHLESWRGLARELAVAVNEEQFRETFGRRNEEIIPILFGARPPDEVRRLADRKEEIYRRLIHGAASVMDGAVELIDDLHRQGVKLAVGSSGPGANVKLVLEEMNVARKIAATVSGNDVTKGKPDPEVFLTACDRLRIPPGRCVVIEDAPSGVTAARRAGARAVAVLTYHPASAFHDADLVVPHLRAVSAKGLMELIEKERPGSPA